MKVVVIKVSIEYGLEVYKAYLGNRLITVAMSLQGCRSQATLILKGVKQ